ncbi:helix-turn-helix domain-containing protein [Paenibacillus sepulcri]|uniref:Helix-turn-helix domain-containing protein n=2 Tax=Paenibacillus sepulcri TaxID=359917 RepID=A0ABS7C174_9BACL|nr:helix-turn-helix domain-containing protein [Paenibacillus sepulcri]
METELLKLHANQIRQRASNMDDQFSYLELSLAHWAFDPKFSNSIKNVDFIRDFQVARDITKTLQIMQGSNPLARQVELYINKDQPVRFTPEYDVMRDEPLAQSYNALLTEGNQVFWSMEAASPDNPGTSDLALIHKIPGYDLHPIGFIMVRLDQDKAAGLLKTLTPYNDGDTFMMEENGSTLISNSSTVDSSAFDEALKKQVFLQDSEAGSFLYSWNHNTYTVSYGTFSRIGVNWKYVSAAPIGVITKPVVLISKFIISLSMASLLLAALLSWLASRKIYSPVNRLVHLLTGGKPLAGEMLEHRDEFLMIEKQWQHLTRESTTLQHKLAQQLPHVKEGFLLQLLQGFLYSYSEEDIRERMRSYGWAIDGRQFLVLHIQLTGFENLEDRFTQGDEGLVTFAAANITAEVATNMLEQADVINFHDLTIGLIMMLPDEQPFHNAVSAFSEELTQAVNQLLKLHVCITIGQSSNSIIGIPSLFEEAKQASGYRRFGSQNQLIDLKSQNVWEDSGELRYPFVLEREIIQAIRTGKREEAEEFITAFMDALILTGSNEIEVQQGMLQLLGSIQHAIRQAGMSPGRIFKSVNMYEQLSQIREPQKMFNWFKFNVVQTFVREFEARADVHVKKMVEAGMIYLQNHYMKDISLDSCAEHIGTNPVTLSKIFKQVSGKNFIDYLTELRMDKARELLRDTQLKINDVAEGVGYQQSYFNRIFKKQQGITPGQYRESSREI